MGVCAFAHRACAWPVRAATGRTVIGLVAKICENTVVRIIALALGYYALGRAGLYLAIPPSEASPVWLSAGLAAGALLVCGYRVWPGVFFGAFFVNFLARIDPAAGWESFIVPAQSCLFIGIGATVQALLGAFLVRRFVTLPNPLENPRDIGLILALAGPVACVVSPFFGVTGLYLNGIIPLEAYPFSWFTWWVGDSLGVTVLTPVMLFLAGGEAVGRDERKVAVLLPILICFVLTVWMYDSTRQKELELRQQELFVVSDNLHDELQYRINDYVGGLQALRGFYLTSQNVTHDEFVAFTTELLAQLPGLRALEWVPRVTAENRDGFTAEMRERVDGGFGITERDESGALVPASEHAEYCPVTYIAPLAGNEYALGFDLCSSENRRRAIEKARDTGGVVATAPVVLMQENGSDGTDDVRNYGTLLISSLSGAGVVVDDVVLGVVRVADLIDAHKTALRNRGFDMVVTDVTGEPVVLSGDAAARAAEIVAHVDRLSIGDRVWELRVSYDQQFLLKKKEWFIWATMVGGLMFATLLNMLILVITGQTRATQRVVEQRTAELERSNKELELFAHVASHDLQEPLRMITNFAALIEKEYDDKLDDDGRQYIRFTVDSAKRMSALINDLMDFASVNKSGTIKGLRRVDSGGVLRQALADMHQSIRDSGAKIVVPDDMPDVTANPPQLERLFRNLIGNAIKYRRKEEAPRVEIGVSEDDGFHIFTIRDNGIGIEEPYLERIFLPFKRLHDRDSEYEGTGMGLSICKKIVDNHGGRLSVASEPGKGSVFTFSLPRSLEPDEGET